MALNTPLTFKRLLKQASDEGTSVEDMFTLADLDQRVVIRDAGLNQYMVFGSRKSFLAWCETIAPANRCFNEVIFGSKPQHLKFDIDAKDEQLDAIADADEEGYAYLSDLFGDLSFAPSRRTKARKIVENTIAAILAALDAHYPDINPRMDDLVVTESNGNGKYSYHVMVVSWCVADYIEAKGFTESVVARLQPDIKKFIDTSVNSRTQCFRLPGSTKPGVMRPKTITGEFGTATDVYPEEMFITAAPGARILPRVFAGTPLVSRPVLEPAAASGVIDAAVKLASDAGLLKGHCRGDVRGLLICFKREEPTHCRLCNEIHHRDNSLMLRISPDGIATRENYTQCTVYELCRQAKSRSKTVGTIEVPTSDLPPKPAAVSVAGIAEAVAKSATLSTAHTHDSPFDSLPGSTRYCEPNMRAYETEPATLAVCAQMKLGKTKALRKYIDTLYPADGLELAVIRFISFRQTFSAAIAKNFPDFTLYSEVQGDLDSASHPRLIIQVESLHRLRAPTSAVHTEAIDLLVLDESESILQQFSSGLHKHFSASFAMFQWLMRTAKKVICIDANLSSRTFRVLQDMRPNHPIHFHWNMFSRAADDKYWFTQDHGAWLSELHRAVGQGKKCVLPTNSLAEAKAYEQALRNDFPEKQIQLYCSEMSPSEKARHFGDVESHWGGLDVLICTPTCSAGVSFEASHFDTLFASFCDRSCDVETCRQMMARVRRLNTKEHFIYLQAKPGLKLPTDPDEIRALVYDKREGLYKGIDPAILQWRYGLDGTVEHYTSDFFNIWLETERIKNLSKNDFVRRFITQVASTGAQVAMYEPKADDAVACLEHHKDAKKEVKREHAAAVASSRPLMPDEAAQIQERMRAQQDVPPDERWALERYFICNEYSIHGQELDADFVVKYSPQTARTVFKNLAALAVAPTIDDAIETMRMREISYYEWARKKDGFDLTNSKGYIFTAHFIVIWLLRVCGFELGMPGWVHQRELSERLMLMLHKILKMVPLVTFEFEVPPPRVSPGGDPEKFLRNALNFINSVSRLQYGMHIVKSGPNFFQLTPNATGKLFFEGDGPRPYTPPPTLYDPDVHRFIDDVLLTPN